MTRRDINAQDFRYTKKKKKNRRGIRIFFFFPLKTYVIITATNPSSRNAQTAIAVVIIALFNEIRYCKAMRELLTKVRVFRY